MCVDICTKYWWTFLIQVVNKENMKGAAFNAGEHVVISYCVANIYSETKATHGFLGPVLVIVVEDVTKVKSRITREIWSYGLVGLCGLENTHNYVSSNKLVVGGGLEGYDRVIEAFVLNQKNEFRKIYHG